jgi:hypothetical protein
LNPPAGGLSTIPGRVGAVALAIGLGLRGGRALAASRDLAAALSFSGCRTFGFGLAQPAL